MPIDVTMPRLSDTMEQGTVVKWNVKEGDSVSVGDVLADIETDKATMELEAFDEGTVAKIIVAEGESIGVGQTIVVLAEEGESVEDAASGAGSATSTQSESGSASTVSESATAVAEPPQTAASPASAGDSANGRVFASPLARKIAAERGIDLGSLQGTGPSGRIVKKDVEGAQPGAPAAGTQIVAASVGPAAAPPSNYVPATTELAPSQLRDEIVPLSNMRGTIARRLVESKTSIPHYQVTVSVRMDELNELRAQLNEQLATQGVKLSVNDFIVRACALAMHEHPFVNSSWSEQSGQPAIQIHGLVNVGVAVALPPERGGGLVVATIRDADRIGLRQISSETKRLAVKAREKGLSVEDMSDSTFTISNLGMFGVDEFTAIINPPNAAILAVGQAVDKPFVEKDEDGEPILVVGSEMSMTMSSDHRIIDGAMAAQYLASVRQLLENPAALLV